MSGTSPPRAVTPYFNHHGGAKSTGLRPRPLDLHHHDEPPRRTADEKPPRPQTKSHHDQDKPIATMTPVPSSSQPLSSSRQVQAISSPPTRLLIGHGVVGRLVASPHWSGQTLHLAKAEPAPEVTKPPLTFVVPNTCVMVTGSSEGGVAVVVVVVDEDVINLSIK